MRMLTRGMRSFATLAFAAVSFAAMPKPAQAQTYDPRYPVCMTVYRAFGGEWIDCSYTSLPQCRASASGRSATCSVNPYFVTPPIAPRGRWRHRPDG
jgi:hypothetical protein